VARARAAIVACRIARPVFPRGWSGNDDLAHHLRCYTRTDFARLGEQAGLRRRAARYFHVPA